jgi:excinuclease UvrABC ATPase subunit
LETRIDVEGTECTACSGTGLKLITAAFLDRVEEVTIRCPACAGNGRVPPAEKPEPAAVTR